MSSYTAVRDQAAVQTVAPIDSGQLNPTKLDCPSFLLNAPFSYSTETANNAWMRDLDESERQVNLNVALKQFLALYNYLSSRSLVYLLPTPKDCWLQDLVFTANLGSVLTHAEHQNTVVLSNFASKPRVGETEVGEKFFQSMGYDVHVPPYKFEGEAELKHLHDNVYVGGYGERSQKEAYDWMEEQFGMEIIKVHETDEYLYHLDCSVFPITREQTIVCTEMFTPGEIAEIENHTEIIDVSRQVALPGLCNTVRLGNNLLNASNIHELQAGTPKYAMERDKNRRLEDISGDLGFELSFFNISEFLKGGAVLSCMVMHLNRVSYNFSLI